MGAIDRSGSVKDDVVISTCVRSDRGVGGKSRGARKRENARPGARVRRPIQMNVVRVNINNTAREHIVQVCSSRARNRKTR